MPRTKLTEKAIAKLAAPTASGKQIIHWDAELRGFGVLCSGVSNSRTYVVQRDLPGGKTRRITVAATNEMALAEAKERACEILVDLRKGVDPKRKAVGTLQETLDAYLQSNKELAKRSRDTYTMLVTQHLAAWKDRRLVSISPEEVDAMHRKIATDVARRGRYAGRRVANDAMRTLRLLYNWASSRDDSMPRNPMRIRKSEWHKVTPRRNPIDANKLKDFYAAVNKLPDMGRDYLLLLLFTGMRRNEAMQLTWDEVDFSERIIRLPAARTKAGRQLDLPMSDFVRDLLVGRRQLGNAKFVFPGSYSASGHVASAQLWTEAVKKHTKIEFNLHDLRRTFMTVAESADISMHIIKALVNHSLSSGVTENYIGMSPERLREPVQRVCDKLKSLCGITAPGGKVAALRG